MYIYWTFPIPYVTYSWSWNYTNMVVGEHGIQTWKIWNYDCFFFVAFSIVVWFFFSSEVHIPFIFEQVSCPNIQFRSLDLLQIIYDGFN